MKYLMTLFSLMLLGNTLSALAQVPVPIPVKDKAKKSVLNNIEFLPRVRLQPEYYHYWIWYKNVFGVKIPMVGLGLHDRYGKKDMRNILQEMPTIAAVSYTKSEAENQHEETDKVYKQELFKYADKEVDYQYTLMKGKHEQLISDITKEITDYSNNNGSSDNIKIISDELLRIQKNIKIIHESHMGNAKKRESYLGFEQELTDLRSLAIRLNKINNIVNNE